VKNSTKLTFLSILFNLIVAGLIIVWTFGFKDLIDFITSLPLNLLVGICGLFIAGYYISLKMEKLIKFRKWNSVLTGIIGLILILLIGVLIGSSVGFIEEGIETFDRKNGIKNVLFDYYVKPLFWIFLFGIIPTVIVGGILGYGIKKNVLQHRI
jgi:Na+/glutamate symporter